MEWLTVLLEDGGSMKIKLHEESRIDAAVEMLITTQRTRDTLLHLEGFVGDPIVILASMIVGWAPCTPAIRNALVQAEGDMVAEERELRIKHGLPFDGE